MINMFTHYLPKHLVFQCQELLHIRSNMLYKIVDILLVEKSVHFFFCQNDDNILESLLRGINEINGVRFMGAFDVLHIRLYAYLVL